ncbi:hypothetical protein EB077_12565, partial [bacterium]|nr:hypothetical protein [bacterium]
KYFPDIHFNYATESKAIGAYDIDNVDFLEIESDIAKEYDDDNRQKLANKCLQYAKEWATIASYGGVSFRDCDFNQQKKLKTQCKQFVRESVLNDEEVRYGSVILTFILIQVILPIIIKWVVEKLFKRLSN